MSDTNNTDQYIEYINSHILPHIDYDKLQASYDTDMVYAKGVLNRLHTAMVKVYGSELLDEDDGDDGAVVVPGLIRGRETGKMALALFDLDLLSSGEHCGTTLLCKYGVVSQSKDIGNPELRAAFKAIGVYDYCYTASIPGDIHINKNRLPEEMKSVLNDFSNHNVRFKGERQKPSAMDKLAAAKDTVKTADAERPPAGKVKDGAELG